MGSVRSSREEVRKDSIAHDLPFDLGPPSAHPFESYFNNVSPADVRRIRDQINDAILGHRSNRDDFPGPLPSTVGRSHLSLFSQELYWITEKSDGERRLFLITNEGAFFADRRWVVKKVNVPVYCEIYRDLFPLLLDGELMTPEGSQAVFLAYDCVQIGDKNLTQAPFSERLAVIETIADRFSRASSAPIDFPFRIESKFFVKQHECPRILSKILPHPTLGYRFVDLKRQRANKNDGLIFVADSDSYRPTRPNSLLKWKWPDKNSIDFKIKSPWYNRNGELELYCGGYQKSDMVIRRIVVDQVTADKVRAWSQHRSELIVECVYDRLSGTWKLCNPRYDKQRANFITTVIQTMETLVDNVTKHDLIESCKRFKSP